MDFEPKIKLPIVKKEGDGSLTGEVGADIKRGNGSANESVVTDIPKSGSSVIAEMLAMGAKERKEKGYINEEGEAMSQGDIYKKMREEGISMPSNEEMESAVKKVEDKIRNDIPRSA